MSKDTILAAVNAMPDEVEIEVLLERLVFMAKVEEGLQQSHNGQVKTHDEVKKLAQAWSK
jgi:predicted transcriptional regulator